MPVVKPSRVGMSGEKLAKVDAAVNALVARKRLAGTVVMVARHGKIVLRKSYGQMDMKDTGFFVPDGKLTRFAANYASNGRGKLTLKDAPARSRYRKSPAQFSGGGGLVSTGRDYMRFCVMIANGGQFQGVRFLKADTVKLMTTNQLPKGVGWIKLGFHRVGVGFGLGLSVRVKASGLERAAKVGECGWGGAASTHFGLSPADGLAVVTLEQTQPYSPLVELAIKGLIYDAIEK